jgi:hypothetical protein
VLTWRAFVVVGGGGCGVMGRTCGTLVEHVVGTRIGAMLASS